MPRQITDTARWIVKRFQDTRIPVWGARYCAPVQTDPGCPPSLLYKRYRIFPGGKAAGAWRWPPTLSNAEVKERGELYPYSTSGPLWPVLGWPLPLPFIFTFKYSVSSIVDDNGYCEPFPQVCEESKMSVRDFQMEEVHKKSHCGVIFVTYIWYLPHFGYSRDERQPCMVTSK